MISNGTCASSTATATIQTDAMPSIANAGPDETRCSPNATLAAVMPAIGTGYWNVLTGGGTVSTPTLNNSTVSSLNVGLNSLEWVVSNGVCPSTRDTMQINVLINLLPIVAGPDQFVCSLSTTLNATPHAIGTGSWMPVGTAPAVATPTNPNASVTFTNQGTYTYVWTVGYLTCPTESDTVQITTYLNPSLALAGADQYTCTLNASLFGNTPAIGTGTWMPLSIEPAVVSPSSPTTAVNFTAAGVYTYIWSIGNGNCPVSNDTVMVTAYAPVTVANAGPDQIICG